MGLREALEAVLGGMLVLGSLPFVMDHVERALDQPVGSQRHQGAASGEEQTRRHAPDP